MDTFEVGEIALYHGPRVDLRGSEVMIDRPGKVRDYIARPSGEGRKGFCYGIDIQSEHMKKNIIATPSSLRKLPPPNTTTSWDECVFKPKALICES